MKGVEILSRRPELGINGKSGICYTFDVYPYSAEFSIGGLFLFVIEQRKNKYKFLYLDVTDTWSDNFAKYKAVIGKKKMMPTHKAIFLEEDPEERQRIKADILSNIITEFND